MTERIHPIEELLGLEPEYFKDGNETDYTVVQENSLPSTIENSAVAPVQEAPVDVKDADDIQIDKNIDEVYNKAIDAFKGQTEMVEIVDPRYSARTAEVAANYLTIALNAMAVKSRTKADRVRRNAQNGFIPYANGGAKTVNNNLIVADRADILKMMMQDDKPHGEDK